jgi:heat shock protein HslJ
MISMSRPAVVTGVAAVLAIGLVMQLAGCAADGTKKVIVRPPPTEVRGGRFALVALGGQPPESDRPLDLTFGADGRVSGFAGVNQFNGPFEMAAAGGNRGTLRFGELASTLMAGPANLMNQEKRYLDALRAVDGYIAEGGLLELTAGGQPVLRYRALGAATRPAGGR